MNFLIVLRKELLEQWRTYKLLIVAAVLVVFGLISPLLAKLTPELLKAVPNMPPALAFAIPVPTLNDAVAQYVKNMSQFGILLALLMSMGSVAQEKERGTAAMMLTRQVSRETFLLAKFTALAVTFAASLVLASLGCWYYTLLLFQALDWIPFLALNGLMLVVFLDYIAMTLLCSTLARSQAAAAGLAFCGLVLLGGLGALPRIGDFLPGKLFSWGTALLIGKADPAWPALWISLGLIPGLLLAAGILFRRQEL
jgi:ABC-2 type transport system permease protein